MYLTQLSAKRFGLLCLMIGAFIVMPIQAQDEDITQTPQPTNTPDVPFFLYNWNAEVLYPAAVRFTIYIDRPLGDIQNVQLTLEPALGGNIVLNVNPAEYAIEGDTFTEINYVWEIPVSDPLPFLSLVEYTWLITTRQDGASSVPDAFFFEDDRATWIEDRDEEDRFNLFLPDGQVTATNIRDSIRPVYELLAENTGQEPTFNFALFDDSSPINPCETITDPVTEVEIPCSSEVIEASFAIQNYEPLQLNYTSSRIRNQEFTNILVRRFYADLWENESVPAWFLQGFQNFYQPEVITSLLALQTAARSGNLILMEGMSSMDQRNWENQANAMVIYIADQIGVDGLFELANEASSTEDFATLYNETTGNTLDSLLLDMSDWLFLPSTVALFNYTPYQAATPTPEPTVTYTPFPPTETNTPTATNTLTITPSVTGFLSATPLASLTPTPTQRAGTATVTPRPAGSLIDPAPTAVPAQSESSDSSLNQTQIIAIIAVIGGILLLVAVTVFFRRGNS